MSQTSTTGLLKGKTITLDTPVPDLDGRRVRVVLAAVEEPELQLSDGEHARAWQDWVEHGPQGPIEDEDETELP